MLESDELSGTTDGPRFMAEQHAGKNDGGI